MQTLKILGRRLSENWFLLFLAALSLWGSIQSSLPSLYVKSSFNTQTAHGVTTLIQGISFSVFAAWLFYIFQTVIPYIQMMKKTKSSYSSAVRSISNSLFCIESYVFKKDDNISDNYNASDMINSVTINSVFDNKEMFDKYGVSENMIPSSKPFVSPSFIFLCNNCVRNILSSIDDIQNKELLTKIEAHFIEEIKKNEFIIYFYEIAKSPVVITNDKENKLLNAFNGFIIMKKKVNLEYGKLMDD